MEASTTKYAPFWRRVLAFIVDLAIIAFVNAFLILPLAAILGLREAKAANEVRSAFVMFLLGAYLVTTIIIVLISWLYYAYSESSRLQGTLGKKLLGIQVTDTEGRQVTFQRASARFFGKIISTALLGAGFIMVPFTPQYQGLHDIIASTLVVRYKKLTPEE